MGTINLLFFCLYTQTVTWWRIQGRMLSEVKKSLLAELDDHSFANIISKYTFFIFVQNLQFKLFLK